LTGFSTGIVNSSNANMLINFTVADAAAQSALVAALNDNTFGEYILVDNTSPIETTEETAASVMVSAPVPPTKLLIVALDKALPPFKVRALVD
jgi:hypothetical protein